jgi:hypothetical protein
VRVDFDDLLCNQSEACSGLPKVAGADQAQGEKLMAMQQLDFSVRATASAKPEEQERLDVHKAAMIVISLSLALWVEIALLAHWFFW